MSKSIYSACACQVSQLCPALCHPMDCSPLGFSVHGILRQENPGVGLPCPPPGDLPDPEIEPLSPASPVTISNQ